MKELLQINRQLKKDEIVDTVSRFIKDTPDSSKHGMIEVPVRWINELDLKLSELQKIENEISDEDISSH